MSKIRLQPGEIVEVEGIRCEIVSVPSLNEVEIKNFETGKITSTLPSKLRKPKIGTKSPSLSFDMLTAEQKRFAKKNYDMIRPLIEKNGQKIKDVAKENGVSVRKIHTLLARFRKGERISDLIDLRTIRKGRSSRLTEEQRSIIDRNILEYYETPQKPRVVDLIEKIKKECEEAGVDVPGDSVIRRRLKDRDPQKSIERREGREIAHDYYGAVYGKFPGADFPLAVIQIDHTKLDLVLVDDKKRLPIGRANITLALDVFSRAVLGFFVSFEPVSLLTTGLCLEHAMFPKDDWLEKREITNRWPIWGKPVCIHVDNALEFRSNGLLDFCGEYNVRLEYRPVKTPHYGGHVERFFRTIAGRIHTIPGTTFSNIKQKGKYPSAKKAVVTLHAFEQWLAEYITGVYHNKTHSGICMSPLEKWKQGIRGTEEQPGVGIPPILSDREDVCNLLLPTYERSIQRDGIRLDYIHYFNPPLHKMFLERVNKKNKKVKIKRDPRDISKIKVYDEIRRNWLTIPYRDTNRPSLSLWEWKTAQKKLKEKDDPRNERAIFATLHRMEEIIAKESKQTGTTRRNQSRSSNKKTQKPEPSLHLVSENKSTRYNFVPREQLKPRRFKYE